MMLFCRLYLVFRDWLQSISLLKHNNLLKSFLFASFRFMKQAYISVDVETSGAVPGIYNLLSIGACLVGDRDRHFYRELQPINHHFDIAAMRVGCLGLRCLD